MPGKKYDFKVIVEDPLHKGKALQTIVKIEIDHPVITPVMPTISDTQPKVIYQGGASK